MNKLSLSRPAGFAVACLLLVTAAGCNPSSSHTTTGLSNRVTSPIDAGMEANEFAFYLVDVASLDEAYAAQDVSLLDLKLKNEPLLTLNDIEYYDYSTHYIYLKKTAAILGEKIADSFADPFVVIAGGERCYLGYLLSVFSSFMPEAPYIQFPGLLAEDVLAIHEVRIAGIEDVRNDSRVREVLEKAGKLDSSLRITLTDAQVFSREDVVTMSYSYTVANLSDDVLYVPDSEKMGSDIFHYYTNGLYLTKVNDPYITIGASQQLHTIPNIYEKWDINWFTELKPGESLHRTVLLSGYPEVPAGAYRCFFRYSGPGMIPKKDRTLHDGRIWIGEIDSNTMEIVIED